MDAVSRRICRHIHLNFTWRRCRCWRNSEEIKSRGRGVDRNLAWLGIGSYLRGVSAFLSPAHLNPAVTLGMAMAGKFAWANVIPYCIAQTLGGILGGVCVWIHYYPHWQATKDADAIRESLLPDRQSVITR